MAGDDFGTRSRLSFHRQTFLQANLGTDWRNRFSVDSINGLPGHELKYRKRKLIALYSRVGFDKNGSWRTFGLRKDFFAAEKLQVEDDISASIVLPASRLEYLHPKEAEGSIKFIQNCEYRLFQRPDEASYGATTKQRNRIFRAVAISFPTINR